MDMPEFPRGFIEIECGKVAEARWWRKNFGLPPDDKDDANYAQCEFISAGCGLKCENCDKFMSTTPPCSFGEKKYVPLIEKFYKDLAEWEKKSEVYDLV